MNEELVKRALHLLATVSLFDFPDNLAWGRWSRELACAALYGPESEAERLIKYVEDARKAEVR